jgi:WD40 repeat protein
MVAYDLCQGSANLDDLVLLDVRSEKVTVRRFDGTMTVGASGTWNADATEFGQILDDTVHVWGRDGRLLRKGTVPGAAFDVQFTRGGDRLVISGADGRLGLLDARSMTPVGSTVDFESAAWAVPGPDERHAFAIVGSADSTYFWRDHATAWALVDLETGSTVREGSLEGLGFVMQIAYAPDGRHGVMATLAGKVMVVDLDEGRPVRAPVVAHPGGAAWTAFSPDGQRLLTGGTDGSVALWDVDTATITARVRVPRSVLTSSVFRPDGSVLIIPWWEDPAVYVWDPSPERALEFACREAGRDLSEDEWREHFGDEPYRETCPEQ